MDLPPAYESVVLPCQNPYIASRQQTQPDMTTANTTMLRSTFDPASITVRGDAAAGGQTATAPRPEGWAARDVSAADWDVFAGQVAGVKDSRDGCAVGALVGEWNAWFFAPRGCLVELPGVRLRGRRDDQDEEEEQEEDEAACGGGNGFYTARQGRLGFNIGGSFVGLVSDEGEVGLKVGGLVLGVTHVKQEEEQETGGRDLEWQREMERDRTGGIELQAV